MNLFKNIRLFMKKVTYKNKFTIISTFLIIVTLLYYQFSEKKWEEPEGVIKSDVKGYYAYLPLVFIFDDLAIEHPEKLGENVWFQEDENGVRVVKYTCGMSIMYSPFFFLAHGYVHLKGLPKDGYSSPYSFAIAMSSFFYVIIGLFFLSKLLLIYFKDIAVAISLIVLYLGTNLFHYTASTMTYSHSYSFSLIVVFMYFTLRWKQQPKVYSAIILGISSGLIVLIRPIDIILLLFFFFFGDKSIQHTIKQLFQKKGQTLLMLLCFFIILSPQFLYFKYISGSFLYYSYTGEKFYFLQPHLIDSVFSFRNGWLVYSPLMSLAIIGFLFLSKMHNRSKIIIVGGFIIYYYIITSWWCWWYAGFGNRAFINLYPFLSIPIASLLEIIFTKKIILRWVVSTFILIGVFLNIFQNYQYENAAIHWDAMTKEAYIDSFGRTRPSQLFSTFLRHPAADFALLGKDAIYEPKIDTINKLSFNFNNQNLLDSNLIQFWQSKTTFLGNGALYIPDNLEFVFNQTIDVKNSNSVYVELWVKNSDSIVLVLSGDENNSFYANSNEIYKTKNEWKLVHLYATLPNNHNFEKLNFYIWNIEFNEFYMDNFSCSSMFIDYFIKEI